MAKRLNPRHQEMVRAKIQTQKIIDALHAHLDGARELSKTQVQAASILLNKSMANPATETDLNISGSLSMTWPLPKTLLDQ